MHLNKCWVTSHSEQEHSVLSSNKLFFSPFSPRRTQRCWTQPFSPAVASRCPSNWLPWKPTGRWGRWTTRSPAPRRTWTWSRYAFMYICIIMYVSPLTLVASDWIYLMHLQTHSRWCSYKIRLVRHAQTTICLNRYLTSMIGLHCGKVNSLVLWLKISGKWNMDKEIISQELEKNNCLSGRVEITIMWGSKRGVIFTQQVIIQNHHHTLKSLRICVYF